MSLLAYLDASLYAGTMYGPKTAAQATAAEPKVTFCWKVASGKIISFKNQKTPMLVNKTNGTIRAMEEEVKQHSMGVISKVKHQADDVESHHTLL